MIRPVVVASQCLGFAAVRYNGAIIEDEFVQRLAQFVDIIEVCPEVGIGLGVPRDPIRMQQSHDGLRLVQPATRRDITSEMHAFTTTFSARAADIDGFILKARSPSCGTSGVSVFDGDGSTVVDTAPGMFAAGILQEFPDLPVENELALRDATTRAHFLTRVFTLARFRRAAAQGQRSDLVAFHAVHENLLSAYDTAGTAALGHTAADPDAAMDDSIAAYRRGLHALLAMPTQPTVPQTQFPLFPGELA